MSNVFFITDYTAINQKLIDDLGISKKNCIDFEELGSDTLIHEWLLRCFQTHKIDILIIPLSLSINSRYTITGLVLSMHLRLHFQLPVEQRLTPIILVTDADYENIIYKCINDAGNSYHNLHHLLSTEGFQVSKYKIEDVKEKLDNLTKCEQSSYEENILNHIKVIQKEDSGKHSIANAWGCYKLAKVIGYDQIILSHSSISDKIFSIYSKYLISLNDAFTEQNDKLELPDVTGKRILFIDDQANEGWGDLMSKIFETAKEGFFYIDSGKYKNTETNFFTNYSGFIEECEAQIGKPWDLILIDLRLHPEQEDSADLIDPPKLSGYQLISKFLDANNGNEGYQIMAITASNKIWNLDAVFKKGVANYYIKESPDYNYSLKETKDKYKRFVEDVLYLIQKNYMYEIFELIKEIKHSFSKNPLTTKYFQKQIKEQLNGIKYQNLIIQELDTIFQILSSYNENRFNLAMIMLYKILEYLNEIFYKKMSGTTPPTFHDGTIVDYFDKYTKSWKKHNDKLEYYNKESKKTEQVKIKPEWLRSTSNKILNLITKKITINDDNVVYNLISLTDYRNDFIHSDITKRMSLKVLSHLEIVNWIKSITNIIKHL